MLVVGEWGWGEGGRLVHINNIEFFCTCFPVLVYNLLGTLAADIVKVKESEMDKGYPVVFISTCLEITQQSISGTTQHHLVDSRRKYQLHAVGHVLQTACNIAHSDVARNALCLSLIWYHTI
jgi:hypothetical protein